MRRGKQKAADVTMYSAQVPSPPGGAEQATRRPTSARASRPPPAATTTPLPSRPGTTGRLFLIPYSPRKNTRSEGLMGAAAICTKTCPLPGRGTGRATIAKLPGVRSKERSSMARMVVGIACESATFVMAVVACLPFFMTVCAGPA